MDEQEKPSADSEALALLRENNLLLRQILSILTAAYSQDRLSDENCRDFVMNVIANILANDIINPKK